MKAKNNKNILAKNLPFTRRSAVTPIVVKPITVTIGIIKKNIRKDFKLNGPFRF